MSLFNREIVNKGYITQLGINHKNEFNFFNLSCDLMEIFRPMVDKIVYENRKLAFDREFKYKLIDVCNKEVFICGKKQYLSNAIPFLLLVYLIFLKMKKKVKY